MKRKVIFLSLAALILPALWYGRTAGTRSEDERKPNPYRVSAQQEYRAANSYYDSAHYLRALEHAERAVDLMERAHGETSNNVASALTILGLIHGALENFDEARHLLERAIEMRKELKGANHPYVGTDLANLADLYFEQGKYDEALPYFEESVAILSNAPDNKRGLAHTINNWGRLHRARGEYKRAEELFNNALAIRRQLGEAGELHVSFTYCDLAQLGERRGDGATALSYYNKALEIQEKVPEKAGYHLSNTLHHSALVLRDIGETSAAIENLERAVAIRSGHFPGANQYTANSMFELARLYEKAEQYDRAEQYYTSALGMRELLPDKEEESDAANYLAELYRELGRFVDAEPLHRQALALRQEVFGVEHPKTLNVESNLALLLEATGRFDEAEASYKRILRLREKKQGPSDLSVALALNNLATYYSKRDLDRDALPLFERALSIYESHNADSNEMHALCLSNLATSYVDLGRVDEALPLMEKGVSIYERALGKNHSKIAEARVVLGMLYSFKSRQVEAIEQQEMAIEVFESHSPLFDAKLTMTLCALAQIFAEQQAHGEAKRLLERAHNLAKSTPGVEPAMANGIERLLAQYNEVR